MLGSKSYYRAVYSRFWSKAEAKISNPQEGVDVIEMPNDSSREEWMSEDHIEYIGDFIGCKRSAKELIKLHDDVISYYINELGDIDSKTIKKYGREVLKFITFEPTLNPERLQEFVESRFWSMTKEKGAYIRETDKTKRCIQLIMIFLQILYKGDIKNYNLKDFKLNYDKFDTSNLPLTPELLFVAYDTLIQNKMYKDAILLHSLYSLSITVKTLCNIKYNNVSQSKTIEFYDFTINATREVYLCDELFNELMYLKTLSKLKTHNILSNSNEEISDTNIENQLIFGSSSSVIYRRFKNKFNHKIEWFIYTPGDIMKLSLKVKTMKSEDELEKSLSLTKDGFAYL